MSDKISDREIALIKIETLLETYPSLKKIAYGPIAKNVRKAVEDDKKIALAKASNPNKKKSWQDNPWLYFIMGIIITVIGGLILKFVFNVI